VIKREHDRVVPIKQESPPAYTVFARDAIHDQIRRNKKVVVLTAAMCQGNKLEPVRAEFPDQFFDTGICEGHAVAFAGGQAKAGLRPIVDIYSTFLQRSYDQIFQEVTLQNLPVTFMLDRAGLTGPDGATHHGVFDLGYMRIFPNMVVMAPGDGPEIAHMLDFALRQESPCSVRYPKTTARDIQRERTPIELGKAEILSWGTDAAILCCGTQLSDCEKAAATLRDEGLSVGVVNARFVKPIDKDVVIRALQECAVVISVEEGALAGGFGSAVAEVAVDAGVDASHLTRLGLPDQFIEHGDRAELLAEYKLDASGIAATVRRCTGRLKLAQ
jgi:1-deoxy-D-xylulose-5-phosphate synthase